MADPLLSMMSPSLQLADLRQRRIGEMKHNLSLRGRGFATAATPSDLEDLEADAANDPDTGDAARAAVAKRQAGLAADAAYMSPEDTDVRNSQQKDALAKLFMQQVAPVEQSGKNQMAVEAAKAQEAEKQRDFTRELMGGTAGAPNDVGGRGYTPNISPTGAVSFRGVPAKKPTTEEQRALDTMQSLSALGPELLARFESQYPGIEKDPTKYGGLMGMLKGAASGAAYKMGYMKDPDQEDMNQLTGYLEAVLPRMLSSGRINREQYADLKMHVPQLGLSAGANYERAKRVLTAILPHVRAAIGTEPGTPSQDPYSDPNYQPR